MHMGTHETPNPTPRTTDTPPLVRHRDDVSVVQVLPLTIATSSTFSRRRWSKRVAIEPCFYDVVVILFGPKQTADCLANHVAFIRGKLFGNDRLIEFICFQKTIGKPLPKDRAENLFRLAAAW
jgi:hypothetical protein